MLLMTPQKTFKFWSYWDNSLVVKHGGPKENETIDNPCSKQNIDYVSNDITENIKLLKLMR